MAIDPITMALIGAGAKGLSRAVGVGSRLLQPKFGSTQYGRELKNITKHGMLTPGQETGVIGNVARTANRQSALASSRYMGGLINRGMGGSVSAQRGLREAEADVRRTVADTSRGMFQQEESAKRQAKIDYARAVDKDKAERRQAWTGLVTTGLDTAGDMATKFSGMQGGKNANYMDLVNKYGKANIQEYDLPGGGSQYGATDQARISGQREQAIQFLNKASTPQEYEQRLNQLATLFPELFPG